ALAFDTEQECKTEGDEAAGQRVLAGKGAKRGSQLRAARVCRLRRSCVPLALALSREGEGDMAAIAKA
ncbi:MAG: hypothetical protein V7606_2151, partial [Burkholderiales bacterium]